MTSSIKLHALTVTCEQALNESKHNMTVTFAVVGQAAYSRPVVKTALIGHRGL